MQQQFHLHKYTLLNGKWYKYVLSWQRILNMAATLVPCIKNGLTVVRCYRCSVEFICRDLLMAQGNHFSGKSIDGLSFRIVSA